MPAVGCSYLVVVNYDLMTIVFSFSQMAPLDHEEGENIYTELEEETVYAEVDVHREDRVDSMEDDEGIGMGEMDNRLEVWAWLEDYEDDRWEAEVDTDSVVIDFSLTEDEEEEEIWE